MEDFFLRRCNCNDFCEYSDSTSSVSGSFVDAVVARGADVFVGEVIDCAEVGRFIDVLDMFEQDSETKGIVMVGEIGGSDEQLAAEFIKSAD